mmetsp:Transcript_102430/g.176861  ORF Transcript_102430/g.176861 Transcript_102430/m.176861 type:complete len:150 (-) Transcript_102430:56-505(-)
MPSASGEAVGIKGILDDVPFIPKETVTSAVSALSEILDKFNVLAKLTKMLGSSSYEQRQLASSLGFIWSKLEQQRAPNRGAVATELKEWVSVFVAPGALVVSPNDKKSTFSTIKQHLDEVDESQDWSMIARNVVYQAPETVDHGGGGSH